MNNTIIEFYREANKLKSVDRTGWVEVGIPREKVESVADHIGGSVMLAIAIVTEKNLTVDFAKVVKMISVRELAKTVNEVSITGGPVDSRTTVVSVLSKLTNGGELVSLYDEAVAGETNEAKFVKQLTKIESDLQAKIYEKAGDFSLENAKADVANYPEGIITPEELVNPSDGWLAYDRRYYTDDVFVTLSNDIKNM